mmetsp:Transcript_5367/g.10262  ORF Transcript_5367/g.10262 Transcript_5367/m.10262 type:complete len:356 (-) Transcript_5367:241-1308(-)
MSQMPPQWLGLLRWSLKYNDGTNPSKEAKPMSEEDKKFLEKVMKELVVDENQKMRAAIAVLKIPEPALLPEESKTSNQAKEGGVVEGKDSVMSELEALDAEEQDKPEAIAKKEETLEMLYDIVDNGPDNAENFIKLGGAEPLLACISSAYPSIKRLGCQLVMSISQNHQKNQVSLLSKGYLQALFKLLREGSDDGETLGKAIGATSALVRGCQPGEEAFKKAQGLVWLIKALDKNGNHPTRVTTKSLGLLRHFIDTDKKAVPLLVQLQAPKAIFLRSADSNIDIREQSLEMLIELCKNTAVAAKTKEGLVAAGAKAQLETRAKTLADLISKGDEDEKEMYAVEAELVGELRKLLG